MRRSVPSTGIYTNTDAGVSSLADCYAQIYADCDEAIALFNQSGMDAKTFYEPSLALAIGVKARAALCREDWETAAEYAGMISASYDLMSADESLLACHSFLRSFEIETQLPVRMYMWWV